MTHSKCGLLLLLATAGAIACGGDPTSSFREGGEKIVATPSVVFVNQGASIFVIAERQDSQGNQLTANFEPADVGSQITVTRDTTFLETTNGTVLKTRDRFIVTGLQPGATSFTITSGDLSLQVPVKVVPIGVAATFSNATPAANEPLIVTLPAGYKFSASASAVAGADTAFVQSFSADSTAITILLPPGATGTLNLGGVVADFLPGAALTLPTSEAVTVAAVVPLGGTGATGTAPSFTVLPFGETSVLFDGGTYDYASPDGPARLYKLTIPADGDYTVTLNWGSAEDLGIYYFLPDGTTAAGSPADALGAGGHPESSTSTFTAGTYFMSVVNFSATNPTFYTITFTGAPPASGG